MFCAESFKADFKADYDKYGADDLEKQAKHLHRLADEYVLRAQEQNSETKNRWILYLKAHALLNSTLLRCSPDEVPIIEGKIFDLECHWYGGTHPLRNVEQLREITQLNKVKLSDIRGNCKSRFTKCGALINGLEMDDMFSPNNERLAEEFSEEVKSQSEYCTQQMIEFAQLMCRQSEGLVGEPPCRYAIIALGSLARNEATPYSDLEYTFLIEPGCDREYFTKLAIDTYFRISNLGETPLKYYYIEEFYNNYRSISEELKEKAWFVDKAYSGFKIDGLLPKAGNIPTGNGLSEMTLTVTVDELMARYIASVNQSDVKEVAGLADLLFSTVLLHSHADSNGNCGSALFHEFKKRKQQFETNFHGLTIGRSKLEGTRMGRLVLDIDSFDYCPGNIREDMRDVKIKTHIFRYPTILAHNIKIALNLNNCDTAWEIFEQLHSKFNLLSKEMLRTVQFILMSAIWIRNSAYLSAGTQKEELSFHPTYIDQKIDDRFFVPMKLYIAMGCRLVPIKQSILKFVHNKTGMMSLDDISGLFKSIAVDKTDCLLRGRLHYICGDFQGGLQHIQQTLKSDIPIELESIQFQFKDRTTDAVYLLAYLLFHNGEYAKALNYFNWLIYQSESSEQEKLVYLASLYATKGQCLVMLGRYEESKGIFDIAGHLMIKQIGAASKDDMFVKLLGILHRKENQILTEEDIELCLAACVHIRFIADSVRYHQGRHNKTLQSFRDLQLAYSLIKKILFDDQEESLTIVDFEISIALYHMQLAKYSEAKKHLTKANDIYNKVFGNTAATVDQSAIQLHIGTASLKCGEFDKAEKWGQASLEVLDKCGQKSMHNRLSSHHLLAEIYLATGKYQQSTEQLEMCDSLISSSSTDGYVLSNVLVHLTQADLVYHEGQNETDSAIRTAQLQHAEVLVKRVIKLLTETVHVKVTESHPDMAATFRLHGQICLALNKPAEGRLHAEKALRGFMTAYGNANNHPDISKTFILLGEIGLALDEVVNARYHIDNALSGLQTVFGLASKHPLVAEAWYILSKISMKTGSERHGLEQCAVAIYMQQESFKCNSYHPELLKYATHFLSIFIIMLYSHLQV